MSSEYEQLRHLNIEKNKQYLQSLGVAKMIPEKVKAPRQKRKRKEEPAEGHRKSSRVRKLPPSSRASVAPPEAPRKPTEEAQLEEGHKVKDEDGIVRWCGECFGSVEGVKVGTVFGEGDYQRLGRREMAACGFHVPFVQPEWLQLRGACYSLILNNDNGSGKDKGVRFEYVGGGGRHRGQNRTAAQSFDQNFNNLTNAALKTAHDNKQPVRVIRGPKLASPYRTKQGGFRYDGLYLCTKAVLVDNEDGLKQCRFSFERLPKQPPLTA